RPVHHLLLDLLTEVAQLLRRVLQRPLEPVLGVQRLVFEPLDVLDPARGRAHEALRRPDDRLPLDRPDGRADHPPLGALCLAQQLAGQAPDALHLVDHAALDAAALALEVVDLNECAPFEAAALALQLVSLAEGPAFEPAALAL